MLVLSLAHTCTAHFQRVLLKVMYLLAFHAFLRVGEMTKCGTKQPVLHRFNLSLKDDILDLTISNFKHHQGKNITIQICANVKQPNMCVVSAMQDYTNLNTFTIALCSASWTVRRWHESSSPTICDIHFAVCDTALYPVSGSVQLPMQHQRACRKIKFNPWAVGFLVLTNVIYAYHLLKYSIRRPRSSL